MPLFASRTLLPCCALLTLLAVSPPLAAAVDPVHVPGSLIPDGDDGDNESSGIVRLSDEDVVVIGHSSSPDLPVTDGSTPAGGLDVWVASFDARFRTLRWLVRLGGSGDDRGTAVAMGFADTIYVTGTTFSSDFPVTPGAYDESYGGDENYEGDAFVAKLNLSTGAIEWATYVGGSADEEGTALAVDALGRVVVVGTTGSFDFPTVDPIFSDAYLRDAFVTRLAADGESADFSTYYAGSRHETAVAVAIDASADIYVGTYGRDHEIELDENHILKIDGSTKTLVYDLLLHELDLGNSGPGIVLSDIAVTPGGACYFAGYAEEGNEQLEMVSAFQADPAGGSDLFLGRVNAAGTSFVWSTYLGGSGDESDPSIAVSDAGELWLGGYSGSDDYPLRDPLFRQGAVISRFSANGQTLISSTRFPGSIVDVALDDDEDLLAITGGGGAGLPITGLLQPPTESVGHPYAALLQPLPTGRFLPRRSFEELPPLERVPDPLEQTPLDLDGDGILETLETLPGRHFDPKWGFLELDARGDGTQLISLFLGELGGAQATGTLDYDGDGEVELVVEDPSRDSGLVEGFAIDQNDDDIDLLVVGKGGTIGALFVDLDGDGETEVVVNDPNLSAGQSTRQDIGPGTDGDTDVVFAGGTPRALLDLDGDGELEAILERTGTAGTVTTVDLVPADGDPDLVFIVGIFAFGADPDGDGVSEAIVADAAALPGSVTVVAPGVIFVGGTPMAVGDFDGDEELEVAAQVPDADPDALNFLAIDSDGDRDLAFFGGNFRGVVDLDGDLEHEIVVEGGGDAGTFLIHDGAEGGADGDTDLVLVYDAVRAAVDVDDDGELELIADGAAAEPSSFTRTDGIDGEDGDADLLFLGGTLSLFADLDGDFEIELAAMDPSVPTGEFYNVNYVENFFNSDADAVFVSGFPRAVGDLDGDGELELLVEDSALPSGASAAEYWLEPWPDDDRDVIFVAASIAFLGDLDGDGERELVAQDGSLLAPTVHTFDIADPTPDGDRDVVVVPGGARWLADLDGDGEPEVILQDLEREPGTAGKVDAADPAPDGDADVIFAGGAPRAAGDLDGDGELELVLDADIDGGDLQIFRAVEPAGDGDGDLVFVGGFLRALADLDGDLEVEAVVEGQPGGETSRLDGVEPGSDGDGDVIFTGGRPQLVVDLDGDFEPEVVVEDPARSSGTVGSFDGLDGGGEDGDPDVVYMTGLVQGAASLVDGGELEVVATDAELEGGMVETADVDAGADGDPDVVLVGQELDMSGVQVPDGGESWLIGSLRYITWSLPGAGNVQIDISRDGGVTWQVLFGTTPNDGSHPWWIAGPATTQARLRITHRKIPSYTDISDANFTIRPASITLTAPNGGGSVLIGTQLAITWTSTDLDGGIEVAISRNAGSTWEIIDATTPNDGEKVWGVTGPPTTQGLVRVRSAIDPTISDVSNLTFTIPPASITLTAPNGGQTLLVGSTANITWSSSGLGGPVHVELSRDGGATWQIIAFSTPNDGAHPWLVQGDPTTEGLMRVRSTATSAMSDVSDATFTIPPASLTMTAPNGGQTWNRGAVVNITWIATNLAGNVRIEISRDGGATWAILYGTTPNDGVQPWTVTGPITTQLRMRVSSLNLPAIYDESDGDSTIPPSTLTVTNPNGGGTYNAGSALSINWSSTGLGGNVEIALSRDGGTTWALIDASTGNDGQRTWIVTGPATTQGLMRIRSTSDNTVMDVSNAVFKIQ